VARPPAPPPPAPLFEWRARREVERVEAERQALRARIARLKPRSYARVVAEARLRELTLQALSLESGAEDPLACPLTSPDPARVP
jgi:hypothetical protein